MQEQGYGGVLQSLETHLMFQHEGFDLRHRLPDADAYTHTVIYIPFTHTHAITQSHIPLLTAPSVHFLTTPELSFL